jgi:heme-degrading monooxygenase HmoA
MTMTTMTTMTVMRLSGLCYAGLVLALSGCGSEAEEPGRAPRSATSVVPADDPCQRYTLEADMVLLGPLQGPTVDPESGELQLPSSAFVVSTTDLRLRGEASAQQRFAELVQGIGEALPTQPGLLAVQFGSAESCGTARTLSVWQDEESMLGFVTSPAHTAAMAAMSEVSRGGSIAAHWSGTDASDVSWTKAAEELSVSTRPEY